MYKPKRFRQLAEINVVPYIDVMLVLLIIFMVTAPLLSQGVKVDLPTAQAKPINAKPPEPIIVTIDARGNYYLNVAANPQAIISRDALFNSVANLLKHRQNQGRTEQQILVKGDKNVDYGKVVDAMVLLQHAGAESVGLITQPLR
ncbi:MAG: protein TolR [Gammaproteobacteria bacterium]|nr:protein TolR [Gammaproteobacteria bacterium]